MLNLKKPSILSFEYCKNDKENILAEILNYLKQEKTKTVSLTNIAPLSFIRKIDTAFLSLDIDFYDLNSKNLQLIKKYDKYVNQIRIIVENPLNIDKLSNYLKKIKECYSGSIILFYKFSLSNFNKDEFLLLVNISRRLGITPNLLPFSMRDNKGIFLGILNNFKEDINKGKILIDSPSIYKKITGKNNFCPSIDLMCHIDYNGNFKLCKFNNFYVGNIKHKNINILWKNKNRIIKKKFGNNLINKCLIGEPIKKPYSVLSALYDKIMINKKEFYNDYARFIKNNFINKDLKILDVACGTGILIKKLSCKYDNIEGIELSKEMAEIAKTKTSKKIYQSEMTSFKTGKKYDLVLCTFDSLNYLLSEKILKKAIRNFYLHLDRNGILICDINPMSKFKNHFNLILKHKIGKIKTNWISSFSYPFWRLAIEFEDNDNISREIHYEKIYSISTVKMMMKECKFKNIKTFKESLTGSNLKEKRVFFVAKK